MTRFLDLSDSLTLYTFQQNLDTLSILRCSHTCSRFRRIISSSHQLQYLLELFINEFIEKRQISTNIVDRLAWLRSYQEKWSRPSWSETLCIQSPKGPFSWVIRQGFLTLKQGPRLSFMRIPSPGRGIAFETWHLDHPRYDFPCFEFHPDQDLLVLFHRLSVEVDLEGQLVVELQSMRSGAPHPWAQSPFFHPIRIPKGMAIRSTQIHSHFLAMLLSPGNSLTLYPYGRLYVWNWTTGHLVKMVLAPITTFMILDEHHILLNVLSGLVWSNPAFFRSSGFTLTLDLVQLQSGPTVIDYDTNRAAILASFAYPTTSTPSTITSLQTPYMTTPSSPGIFYPSPQPFTLCLEMSDATKDRAWSFLSSINLLSLLQYAYNILYTPTNSKPPIVPWKLWSAFCKADRVMTLPPGSRCTIVGQRALVQDGQNLFVYDLHERRVRKSGMQDLDEWFSATRTPCTPELEAGLVLPCSSYQVDIPCAVGYNPVSDVVSLVEDGLLVIQPDRIHFLTI